MTVSSRRKKHQRSSVNAAEHSLAIASEVSGKTLRSIIKEQGTLSEPTVISILIQLLREVKQYHAQSILLYPVIHPDHIIWQSGNSVSVSLNFCSLKGAASQRQNPYPQAETLKATGFIAPEQAMGQLGFATDLYALGLSAIYLLTGKLPKQFPSDPQMGTILWHSDAKQISPRFANILDKAIHPYARERYLNAQEMLAALRGLVSPSPHARYVLDERRYSWSHNPWKIRGIAFLIVGLGVIGTLSLFSQQQKQHPATETPSQTPKKANRQPLPPSFLEEPSQTPGLGIKNPRPKDKQPPPLSNSNNQVPVKSPPPPQSQLSQSQTGLLTPQPPIAYAPPPSVTQYIDITLGNKSHWKSQMPARSVVLTFDDGPSPEYTPQVLPILRKHGIRATFFVVGKRVEQHCDLILQIVSQGHELGNHSYSHPFLWKNGENFQHQEIEKGQKAIEQCLGSPNYDPIWFRAPYAAQDKVTVQASHKIGLNTAMWTIDTNDWRKTSTIQSIANQIISTQGRDIILMHDAPEANPNFQHPEASASRQNTVDALDGAITSLKQRGLRFMTLSEAFYHQNP